MRYSSQFREPRKAVVPGADQTFDHFDAGCGFCCSLSCPDVRPQSLGDNRLKRFLFVGTLSRC